MEKKLSNYNATNILKQLCTIRDYLRWTTSRFLEAKLFYGHGTCSAWDEAVHLVFQAISLPIDMDDRILEANLTYCERKKIITWVDQRIFHRIPLPYLTKKAWFAEHEFYVDSRVIVPRSPIGELIRNEFRPWINHKKINHILDLCTGSGCIGIATSYVFKEAEIILSDISKDAIDVAKKNIALHNAQDSVITLHSDLFSKLTGKKFDLIISNPPYVNSNDFSSMPQEYLKEPKLSLKSGDDGLNITRRILAQAIKYLNKGGLLIVEVGNSQYTLQKIFQKVPFMWLNFEDGGDGVFLLTYDDLLKYQSIFTRE